MYTCRWGYCAAVCPDAAGLDQHIFEHINSAQPVQLKGIKRRKIGMDVWVKLPSSDSQDSEAEVRSQIFQPVSNDLPIHDSQAGNTSINTDTTYPIPSFPSFHLSASFPSQASGSQVVPDQSPANTQEGNSQHLSPARTRRADGKRRSASPFIPPTQANFTQLSSPQRTQGTSNSPSQPQATQSSQTSSVELGRAHPSPLRPSPPDSAMPPPSLPSTSTAVMPHTPRESLVRKESMSRLLAFGSAAVQSPKAGQSPTGSTKGNEAVASTVARSRLSVGFTFGQAPSQ